VRIIFVRWREMASMGLRGKVVALEASLGNSQARPVPFVRHATRRSMQRNTAQRSMQRNAAQRSMQRNAAQRNAACNATATQHATQHATQRNAACNATQRNAACSAACNATRDAKRTIRRNAAAPQSAAHM
jgi:hypothetical protein